MWLIHLTWHSGRCLQSTWLIRVLLSCEKICTSYLSHFFVNSQLKIDLFFELMSTMLCLFEILFFFADHTLLQTVLLKSIFAKFILQGVGWSYDIVYEDPILVSWKSCWHSCLFYNTEYFAALNSDYPFTVFDLCTWVCLLEESLIS